MIAPEIQEEIDRFAEAQLGDFLSTPPDTLRHYTHGSTLVKIIESGTLWATQVSCLNDQTEHRYSITLLRDSVSDLRTARGPAVVEREGYFFDKMNEALSGDTTSSVGMFVTCFSALSDDLSQWRAYGGGEGGYAIGFDADWLGTIGAQRGDILAPVRYDEKRNREFAGSVANVMFDIFLHAPQTTTPGKDRDAWMADYLTYWSDQLTPYAVLIKHPSFQTEAEWRCIRILRPEDALLLEFQQRQSMMSRHLPRKFPPPEHPDAKLLPISQIIVGPCRHREVSRISIGDLLLKASYPDDRIMVTVSAVPFQAL